MFLEMPVWASAPVFEKFKTIKSPVYKENKDNKLERFLFVDRTRSNKVVLVAHADTVFDEKRGGQKQKHFFI